VISTLISTTTTTTEESIMTTNEPGFTQADERERNINSQYRPLDRALDYWAQGFADKEKDAVVACDALYLASKAVKQHGEGYWTDDQNFEATMEVYRGILQMHQFTVAHKLAQDHYWADDRRYHDEHERKRAAPEVPESRQTIEWTNRPIKVEIINK